MIHQIKDRITGAVLFSGEYDSRKSCVEAAVRSRADLTGADLRGADLSYADLHGADLRGAGLRGAVLYDANTHEADLSRADLSDADLSHADLSEADLSHADLSGADLSGADLSEADLREARLSRADLSEARLRRADLREADLRAADLTVIRDDIWAVLAASPAEAAGLLSAINSGGIDGSSYVGECCCLVGTLARGAGKHYKNRTCLEPDSHRPAERFFTGIAPGDTPGTNQISKLAAEWVTEWIALHGESVPGPR